jgi:hypothetical protein
MALPKIQLEMKEAINNGVINESSTESKEDVSEPVTELQPDSPGHLSGMRLLLVMSSITLAAFLMLLDAAVVATVSHWQSSSQLPKLVLIHDRQYPK